MPASEEITSDPSARQSRKFHNARCAKGLKLKARAISSAWPRLAKVPLPALPECESGSFIILGKFLDEKVLV